MPNIANLTRDYITLMERIAKIVPERERLMESLNSTMGKKVDIPRPEGYNLKLRGQVTVFKAIYDANRSLQYVIVLLQRYNRRVLRLTGQGLFSGGDKIKAALNGVNTPQAESLRKYEEMIIREPRDANIPLVLVRKALDEQNVAIEKLTGFKNRKGDFLQRQASIMEETESRIRHAATMLHRMISEYHGFENVIHQTMPGSRTEKMVIDEGAFTQNPLSSLWALVKLAGEAGAYLRMIENMSVQQSKAA